ncbi:sensor histidine kinase ParS [Alteromonas sp. D210916BOD_24]|uniref:ATP-binding protein n=1 Tax=Alteromonas sp. D210916BOD_24 TaxID=3157618 RepID=UPI00399D20E1
MTRLFISFYLFVAISLVVISSSLEFIWPSDSPGHTKEFALLQEVLPLASVNAPELLHRLAQHDIAYEVKNIAASGWSQSELNAFAEQQVITLYDDSARYLYAPINNKEVVAITLPYDAISTPYLVVYLLIFLVLLGVAMALWLWPLWRDLSYITRTVGHLGQDSSGLSIALKKRSIMQPIANKLNMLSERVHNLLRDQRELTGAVAHEFRTPIARLKFALEMNPEPDSDTWRGIQADIDELEGLVQEMLDYTQYDAVTPELSISDIPTREMCENLVKQLSLTTDKSLTVKGENLIIRGDGHFIERAISNLLTNAIRHANSQVLVEICAFNNAICIEVNDDGAGVEPALAQRIFEPFYRPDNSRVRYAGGAGLGLAIVQRIQHWHHGSASVKKSQLGGARFVLRYPQ